MILLRKKVLKKVSFPKKELQIVNSLKKATNKSSSKKVNSLINLLKKELIYIYVYIYFFFYKMTYLLQ